MAMTTTGLTSATVTAALLSSSSSSKTQKRMNNVVYLGALNSFGGLKAHNSTVVSLGLPVSTEQCFAKVVSSLRATSHGKRRGGGALSSTCNAADEIFKIAAIMNVLVLIGVAVGFVLLKIEAAVEESE
uniref:Cytochrome b6-f complex subunit 7 n=1 Tax=Fagus sylvatica TaxID=28930 RepID=A0A2N9ITR8_FAGSY